MRQAMQEAVEAQVNFCWWPRIPDYGRLNKLIGD